MTTQEIWRPLQGVADIEMSGARAQAHYAVQWLARAARANLLAQPDDSHTNSGWDPAFKGLTTHPFPNGLRLALRLRDLALALVDAASGPVASLSLDGLTDAQVGERLAGMLSAHGLTLEALATPLPYAMPESPLGSGAAYRWPEFETGRAELAAWFANASLSLDGVRRMVLARGLEAPAPRCWPHHFDLATLVSFPIAGESGTAYIGAGLSPGDGYYDEPYFYVSIYPRPKAPVLPELPAGAHWHEKDFFAAVLTASSALRRERPQADCEAYLAAAVAFGCGAFG